MHPAVALQTGCLPLVFFGPLRFLETKNEIRVAVGFSRGRNDGFEHRLFAHRILHLKGTNSFSLAPSPAVNARHGFRGYHAGEGRDEGDVRCNNRDDSKHQATSFASVQQPLGSATIAHRNKGRVARPATGRDNPWLAA